MTFDSIKLQLQLMLSGHPPHVQNGIPHTTKSGIDAHISTFGYLLERQLLLIAHIDDLSLRCRQKVHYLLHITHHLVVYILALYIGVKKLVIAKV